MLLAHVLDMLEQAQRRLSDGFAAVADAHVDEPDVTVLCRRFAGQARAHAERLAPFADRYAAGREEPESLHSDIFGGPRGGGLGLLRDLQDLYVMASECDILWTLTGQAAQGARDRELLGVVTGCEGETVAQVRWLRTRMKSGAPQALVVA